LSDSREYHIVFLASWYPGPAHPLLGIFIRRHAEAAAMKHKVTVLHAVSDLSMKEGEFRIVKHEEGNLREVILHYGKKVRKNKFLNAIAQFRLLKKHYRFGAEKIEQWYGKPDILHLNVIWPLGSIALRLAKYWKVPMVVSEHWTGYQPEDGRYRGYAMQNITRKTIRKAKAVLPVSESLKTAMLNHRLKGNYQVIPNVVDDILFHPAEKPVEALKMLHVSSLDDAQKNVSGLLKQLARMKRNHPEIELNIVGSGADESAIKRLSNELGLTFRGVNFLGKLEGEALANAYREASVFVMNSRFETQGVVILEALLSGISVIVPQVGGIPEFVNESNGVLFDPKDENGFATAFEKWLQLKSTFDATSIRKDIQARFGKTAVSQQLDEVYQNLLKQC
jgi:glycosyltransferase involved in cell wall biosynthesis